MSVSSFAKQVRYWGAVCGLLWAGFCLSGCRTVPPEERFVEVPPGPAIAVTASPGLDSIAPPITPPSAGLLTSLAATNSGTVEPEVFRVGDSLVIVYADLPMLTPAFEGKIKEDGTITLLYNKTFNAAGKTPGELEKDIRAAYVPSLFKQMTVTVKQVESTRWYYVDGEVRAPNRQIYNSRITVLKAIASSGGFTDFAKKTKVQLTRVDGRTQIINCEKARRSPTLDPEVYPGDKIYVPRRLW